MTRRYRTIIADSARWDGFEFRDDDVVISIPAKCGTTWMQMICALLVFQSPVLPAPLTELSPWMDIMTDDLANVRRNLGAQTHRRFIKSHTPLDGLPFDERVTYISAGRDPRDVAISWDNHFENMNLDVVTNARIAVAGSDDLAELLAGPPRGADQAARFWQWIDGAGAQPEGLGQMVHHLTTFWDRLAEPNVVLFHYADLSSDLESQMRRVAEVLEIHVDPHLWPELVAAATFEQMSGRAEQLAPQVSIEGFWNETGRFFNSGSSGQWKHIFAEGDQARYEARLSQLASPELSGWLHRGWIAAAPE
jgi:hypothetical protein